MTAEVRNRRLEEDEFLAIRQEVLSLWKTGEQVADLGANLDFQLSLPDHKRAPLVFAKAREQGRILVQPRHGSTLFEEQLAAMRAVIAAGADTVSILADPYTRQLRFDLAEKALASSIEAGRSLVSGYPILAHGVATTRRLIEAVDRPCSVRMASGDSRLCKEFFIASGATHGFMGPLQNLAYERDTPVETLVRNYQYEHRLYAWYTEHGAPIILEAPATLTGTLVPPCIAITTSVIDALLGVEQGVRDVIISYGVCGNLTQDVAAIRALRAVGERRLSAAGHRDVNLYTVTPQWMGDFPQDESLAYSVVAYSTLAAAMAGTDLVVTKSTDEALGVPTPRSNEAGVKATRGMLGVVGGQRLHSPAIAEEQRRIERETDAILDRALELGEGDWAQAAVRGVAAGVIDVPFSPSRLNAGKVVVGRDLDGAVRFLEQGDLPLPDDIARFHRERMDERLATYRGTRSDMLAEDIFSLSKALEAHLTLS